MDIISYDKLYHIDEKGKHRIWWMEQKGDSYRTVSGIENGKLVTSEWKLATAKNVGRSNETSGEEQAKAEILSQYTKKRDRKYSENKEDSTKSKIVEPMLAEKFKEWNNSWVNSGLVMTQPKLDGMRCIATKDGLFSRQGKLIVSVPHILEELAPIFDQSPDLVFDGELYNHDLKDNFNEIISLARKTKPTEDDLNKSREHIKYFVYDTISDDKFSRRFNFIREILDSLNSEKIVIVPTYTITNLEELDELYSRFLANGFEGQMIRFDEPYQQKRSKFLLKRKEFLDEEFEVVEILEGQGNWAGYAKSVMCRDSKGLVFNAGIKGDQNFAKELLNRTPIPKTVTVRYQNQTPDGNYRFPIAVAFYEDERDT